jgi:fibronectin-binding autotransporter adhesin
MMTTSLASVHRMSLLFACCLALVSVHALGATCTWTGGGADANWQTTGNWDAACNSSTIPNADDDLIFPAAASKLPNNNNFAAGTAFHSIRFTGGGYTISGNRIALGTTGISQVLDVAGGNIVLTNLSIGAGTAVTLTGSGNLLDLGGVISGAGGSLNISGDPLAQVEVELIGANTYGGGTLLSNLFLVVRNSKAFGTGTVTIAAAASATIVMSGFTVANPGSFGGYGIGNNAVINDTGTWSGPITLTANTGIGTWGNLSLTGEISGNFDLTAPMGGGSVTLSGPNTYTGWTLVSGTSFFGTLFVNGSQSQSTVAVYPKGRLGGTGTVGPVWLDAGAAHLAPGLSPGIINTGNLSIPSGANLDIELNGTTVGTQYDQVNVTGTVTLGGTLNVTLGFLPAKGTTFTIINNDGADAVSGAFAGLGQGATFVVRGVTFQISYTGGTGNDVVLTVQSSPTLAPLLLFLLD